MLAVAVGGDGQAEGMGPEMGHAAEKINRLFRVIILQLSVSWTHATHCLDLTRKTLSLPGDLFLPDPRDKFLPAISETALS